MGSFAYLGSYAPSSLKASQKNLNFVGAKEVGILQHVGKTVKGGNVGGRCACVFLGYGKSYYTLLCILFTALHGNHLFNYLLKAVSALSCGMGGGYQRGEGLGASSNTSLYVSHLPQGIDRQQVWC